MPASNPALPTIGMVLDHPFPPDSRVAREATTLAKAGHNVHLLCAQSTTAPLPEKDMYEGVYLHRVNAVANAKQQPFISGHRSSIWASGLLKNWRYQQQGIDTPWQWVIEDFITEHNINIVHAHDLRVLPAAITAAKQVEKSKGEAIKVIADLHEFYPALIRQLKSKKSAQKGNHAYRRWVGFEKCWLPQANYVWVLDDASRDRVLSYPDIQPEKIGLLPNVVSVTEFDAIAPDPKLTDAYGAGPVLVYAGHVNHTGRGLQFVIAALPSLLKKHPALRLVLAGTTRPDYEADLRQQIDALGVNNAVVWTGPLDDVGMAQNIQAATICLCPTVESEQTNSGIPNKIFQYALYGKPQVVSSAKPQTRWVTQNNCGLSFASGNVEDLTAQLQQLLNNPNKAEELGTNGRNAVLAHSSWEAITSNFLAQYTNAKL